MVPPFSPFPQHLPGKDVSLVAADGGPPTQYDGSDAVAVLLRDRETGEEQRMERNEWGSFYRVYQPNKWAAKRREAQERAAAAAAAAAGSASAAAAVV